ncbi:MAG TPA: VWA domain-containing protein [Pyrinomonadaceae bacterium]|nr:VWA domain-containing protein [Pyrinomonadaceae bacterium]
MHSRLSPRSRALLLASALALFAPRATPQTQQPQPPQDEDVIRVSSDLVQTDVMVFDKSGKFVEGLKPEQFELKVDGRAQAVSFFEPVKAGTFDEEAQLAAARGRSRADRPGPSVPLDRGRLFILFLDDLHVSPGNLSRARDAMLRLVDEQLGQNDEAAVFTASGQLGFLQQMTGDKEILRLAVRRIVSRFLETAETGELNPISEFQAFAIERGDRQVLDSFIDRVAKERLTEQQRQAVQSRPRGGGAPAKRTLGVASAGGASSPVYAVEAVVRSRARALVQQAQLGAKSTLSSLENVVRVAGALPERKVLFFISDGFFIDTQNSAVLEDLRRVSASAARSGTVVYALDARGLSTSTTFADASQNGYDASNQTLAVNSASLTAYQEPLHTLAVETGGRALLDTNDLRGGAAQVMRETSQYYLLAWRPESEPGRGKFRQLEVRVKDRPDLTVRVRRGYSDEPPAQEAEKDKKKDKKEKDRKEKNPEQAELMGALRSQYPRRALPTSVSAGYTDSPAGDPQLTVSVEVDSEALGFKSDGTGEPAALDVVGAVVDDNGKGVSEFDQSLTVSPVQTAGARRRVIYNQQLQLKPGLYQVRVAARDRRTGRAGSSAQWLEVPDVKKGGLALSSLFVGETGDGSAQLAVCADRRFARDSRLGFFLYVYNAARAAAPPDVALQVQIFRDDQPVVTKPLVKIETAGMTDLARLPYGEDLSLGELPAGRYVLQVTAIDRAAKSSATRRASFIVR